MVRSNELVNNITKFHKSSCNHRVVFLVGPIVQSPHALTSETSSLASSPNPHHRKSMPIPMSNATVSTMSESYNSAVISESLGRNSLVTMEPSSEYLEEIKRLANDLMNTATRHDYRG